MAPKPRDLETPPRWYVSEVRQDMIDAGDYDPRDEDADPDMVEEEAEDRWIAMPEAERVALIEERKAERALLRKHKRERNLAAAFFNAWSVVEERTLEVLYTAADAERTRVGIDEQYCVEDVDYDAAKNLVTATLVHPAKEEPIELPLPTIEGVTPKDLFVTFTLKGLLWNMTQQHTGKSLACVFCVLSSDKTTVEIGGCDGEKWATATVPVSAFVVPVEWLEW